MQYMEHPWKHISRNCNMQSIHELWQSNRYIYWKICEFKEWLTACPEKLQQWERNLVKQVSGFTGDTAIVQLQKLIAQNALKDQYQNDDEDE